MARFSMPKEVFLRPTPVNHVGMENNRVGID